MMILFAFLFVLLQSNIAIAKDDTNPLIVPTEPLGNDYWLERHNRYVEEAKEDEDNHIIWIGDSIIEYMLSSALWREKVSTLNATNFGIAGDRVEWLLYRIQDGEYNFHIPITAVVIFVGTNNHDTNTAEQIAEGIVNLVDVTRLLLGDDVAIVVPTLLPRGQYPNDDRVLLDAVNNLLIRTFGRNPDENVHLVRIDQNIVQDDGTISEEDLYDFLHPSDSGYTKIFTPVYDELVDIVNSRK